MCESLDCGRVKWVLGLSGASIHISSSALPRIVTHRLEASPTAPFHVSGLVLNPGPLAQIYIHNPNRPNVNEPALKIITWVQMQD